MIKEKIKRVFIYLWQLPQHLIALLIKLYYFLRNKEYNKYNRDNIMIHEIKGFYNGISLGEYVFVNSNVSETTVKHEIGHSKQSKLLGIFYLLIIGIPSFLHNIIHNLLGRKWNYYNFYTERWADKLMNIKRR